MFMPDETKKKSLVSIWVNLSNKNQLVVSNLNIFYIYFGEQNCSKASGTKPQLLGSASGKEEDYQKNCMKATSDTW